MPDEMQDFGMAAMVAEHGWHAFTAQPDMQWSVLLRHSMQTPRKPEAKLFKFGGRQ